MRNDLPFQGVLYKGGRHEGGNLKGPYHINTNFKNEISFLGTLNKVKKKSFFTPFTSKSADFYDILRVKGAEKQAVSLLMGLRNRQ